MKKITLPSVPVATDLSHIVEKLRPLAVSMEQLVPDPQNARKHNARNLKIIRGSLRRYGQRIPIVINRRTNIIEKGNGTYEAAKLEGWGHIAAVDVDDDPVTAAGFSLTDNRSAELAEWDYEVMGVQLRALQEVDFDLDSLGWEEHEREPILAADWTPPEIDPNFGLADANGHTVKFSDEQWENIAGALQAIRDKNADESLSPARCLELICADWMKA